MAQKRQVEAYNTKHKAAPPFEPGKKVWLLRCHIKTKRPSDKLDDKRLGPFEIKEVVGRNARHLILSETVRIHPVFHVSLLEPYNDRDSEQLTQVQLQPIEVDGEDEWEVEEILDSRLRTMGRCKRETLQYLIKWVGFLRIEATWQSADNIANATEAVGDFHTQYSHKPRAPAA